VHENYLENNSFIKKRKKKERKEGVMRSDRKDKTMAKLM
jgi:hypothetical protein